MKKIILIEMHGQGGIVWPELDKDRRIPELSGYQGFKGS